MEFYYGNKNLTQETLFTNQIHRNNIWDLTRFPPSRIVLIILLLFREFIDGLFIQFICQIRKDLLTLFSMKITKDGSQIINKYDTIRVYTLNRETNFSSVTISSNQLYWFFSILVFIIQTDAVIWILGES